MKIKKNLISAINADITSTERLNNEYGNSHKKVLIEELKLLDSQNPELISGCLYYVIFEYHRSGIINDDHVKLLKAYLLNFLPQEDIDDIEDQAIADS